MSRTVRRVIGLGNPGPEYDGTRHNVGFEVLDLVARRQSLQRRSAPAWEADVASNSGSDVEVHLLWPQTFMNRSGRVLARMELTPSDFAELLLVVDDLDLPVGRLRARAKGSDGGQRGLRSIFEVAGTQTIARLRIGIGGAAEEGAVSRVLAPPTADERALLDQAVAKAADAVISWLDSGSVEGLMQQVNGWRPETPSP